MNDSASRDDALYPWLSAPWQRLAERQNAQGLPHALVVTGLKGVGKSHFCTLLARQLLACEHLSDTAELNNRHHTLLNAGSHPDLLMVEPEEGKRQIRVDDIRALNHFLAQTPQISRRQVVILNPADVLNTNAANALLKTLEEPAGQSVLLLITERFGSVLPTIRSRCQRIHLDAPSSEQAHQWLAEHLNQEQAANGSVYAQSDIERALDRSRGAPLWAADLLAQRTFERDLKWQETVQRFSTRAIGLEEALGVWKDAELGDVLDWWQQVILTAQKVQLQVADSALSPSEQALNSELLQGMSFDTGALLALQRKLIEVQGRLRTGSANDNRALLLESTLLLWQRAIRETR